MCSKRSAFLREGLLVHTDQGNLLMGIENKPVSPLEFREYQIFYICSLLKNTVYKETKLFEITVSLYTVKSRVLTRLV